MSGLIIGMALIGAGGALFITCGLVAFVNVVSAVTNSKAKAKPKDNRLTIVLLIVGAVCTLVGVITAVVSTLVTKT